MTTAVERTGQVTFRGRPMTLLGEEVRVGAKAPDFVVLSADMSPVTLASSAGTVRILSSIPSIDTEICALQVRRFNEEAASLDGVSILAISVDLPFAQRRWCTASDVDAVQVLSDHRDLSFGLAYGVAVSELRILARAVFIVDSADQVVHAQYVPEIGQHPDYEAALAAARAAR